METQNQNNNQKKRKAVLIGLGITVTGFAGYFGWQYIQRLKQEKESFINFPDNNQVPNNNQVPALSNKTTNTTKVANDTLPLQKGSKGANVKSLQTALIAQYGASILPKYGADGDFGTETVEALKKAGLPSTIDASTFNILVKGTTADPSTIATELYNAAIAKNISNTIAALNKIKSTAEYSSVSTKFQEMYRINGVRQTLVNGMLNSFTNENDKQQIRLAFSRIGLKYDGSVWTLSGIDGHSIITLRTTHVWVDEKTALQIPEMVVLGNEIGQQNNYTVFENQGRNFLVPTQDVRYV